MSVTLHLTLLSLLLIAVLEAKRWASFGKSEDDGFYSDWNALDGRSTVPNCVDIPRNMTLCHHIGYPMMRLPNLLEHDSVSEVVQQSASWIPLLNIQCHADTQLFLCSLFSPICLDRPIYPCRSLCQEVRKGCETRMTTYGYPWPDMLKCDRFPADNDMCITTRANNKHRQQIQEDTSSCQVCQQVPTYENILDNFCRADFALKTKIRKVKKSTIICRKGKIFKNGGHLERKESRAIRRQRLVLDKVDQCCNSKTTNLKVPYLIMGMKDGNALVPTLIMEWGRNSSVFKRAINTFNSLDCSHPKIIAESSFDLVTQPTISKFTVLNARTSSILNSKETRTRTLNQKPKRKQQKPKINITRTEKQS